MKKVFLVFLLFMSNLCHCKIAIVSLYDSSYKVIGLYSDLNKARYASRHGYDLYLYHNSFDNTRTVHWSKILAIQKHLSDYEWIFWLDADALIMNGSIKLEFFIDPKYDIIIAPDHMFKCNSGVFLIKNSEWSKDFLKNVYSKKEYVGPYWEQDAINFLCNSDVNISSHFKFIKPRLFNAHIDKLVDVIFRESITYKHGDFIVHFYGKPDKPILIKSWYNKAQI